MFFKKKKEPETQVDKSIGATLYPDKIIIETRNKKDNSTWYSTDSFTILSADATDTVLGNTILTHLDESKQEFISWEHVKQLRNNFKKLTKLKTEKAIMDKAKYVSVYLSNDEVRFEPKKNKFEKTGEKVFFGIPDAIFSRNSNIDEASIGQEIRKAWQKCTFD